MIGDRFLTVDLHHDIMVRKVVQERLERAITKLSTRINTILMAEELPDETIEWMYDEISHISKTLEIFVIQKPVKNDPPKTE